MSNPYIEYYKHQAGTGLAGFQGLRFQRGHGFFGRILNSAIYPLLRFLGKTALSTGADIATDVIANDVDWKDSVKSRLKNAAKDVTMAGVDKIREYTQKGSGRRKRKRKSNLSALNEKTKSIKRKPKHKVVSNKKRRRQKKSNLLF